MIAPSFQFAGIVGVSALLLGGVGGWKLGSSHWQARYQAEVSQGWETQAKGEKAARVAVEQQLAQSAATNSRNGEIIHALDIEKQSIAAGNDSLRDQLRRVRAAEARRACPGHPVPETADQPGTAAGTEDAGAGRFDDLLAAAITEAVGNAADQRALISQLKPQL